MPVPGRVLELLRTFWGPALLVLIIVIVVANRQGQRSEPVPESVGPNIVQTVMAQVLTQTPLTPDGPLRYVATLVAPYGDEGRAVVTVLICKRAAEDARQRRYGNADASADAAAFEEAVYELCRRERTEDPFMEPRRYWP